MAENKKQDQNVVNEKASQVKDAIVDKYEEATAPVEEQQHEDTYTFNDTVIEKISGIAAREIKGVLDLKGNFISGIAGSFSDGGQKPNRGVDVEVGERDVVVSLKMILEYGAPAPQIFKHLRSNLEKQLAVMTGLQLVELNVEVVDVMTREEFARESEKTFTSYSSEPIRYENRYADSEAYRDDRNRQGRRY